MKTIILGFSNSKGVGTPALVCGPEVPAGEQLATIASAKQRHEYPKGIVRLELCTYEARTIAVELPKDDAEPKPKSKNSK